MYMAFLSLSLFLSLALVQVAPIPIPLPRLDVVGEIAGPYIFREDLGQTTKVILQNGLTVIVREQNAVPLVSVTTLVRAGYFDEPDSLSGISHVVEHMFFKGTVNRGVGEVARQTRGLGGTLNAYTAYDRTVYHVVAPAANGVAVMEIQADALWNPAFDPQELDREIEVVLEENNRKLDNPQAVAEERLYGTAFASHRMRRWRIGTPAGLRALTRDDLAAYYARYYQPSNIVLVVVGQFNREEMLSEIVRLYGGVSDTPVEADAGPDEPPQTASRYGWERAPVAQAHVAMGFHVPGVLSGDAYPLEVLSAILTSGRASRFNRILRDQSGVLVRAGSAYLGFRDLGFFRILLETATPLAAERAVVEELERIRRFGVSREELERAKVRIGADFYGRLETVEGTGEQLAIHESRGDWRRLAAFLPGIAEVTAGDVRRVATAFFTPGNASAFEYAPESAELSMTVARFRTGVLGSVPANLLERTIGELPVPARVPPMDEEGLVSDLVREPETLSILRGPEVHVFGDSRLPLVSFGLFFPGGRLYETPENAGITELMLRSALRGTREYDGAAIARRLENAGARIELVNEPDFFGYILEGISGNMHEALAVLMDVVQDPTFPDDQVEHERALQAVELRQIRDDGLRYAVQAFMETLFEGHPYSRPGAGLESSLPGLTPYEVRNWHGEQQRGVMPVIVVVGDTTGSSLVFSIADKLTNEDLSYRDLEALDLPEIAPGSRVAFRDAPRRQSALVYGSAGPRFPDPDRLPLTVLGHVLSGLGGRLFDSIRERTGLAYTVRTYDDFRANAGAFLTYTAFSPANEGQVRGLLDSEIRRLIEGGITDDELTRARNSALGLHEAGLQTRRARTLSLARAIVAGAGIEAVTGFGEAIGALDREAVDAAVRRYLDPDSATVVVVRGQE
jgi:zinc protease